MPLWPMQSQRSAGLEDAWVNSQNSTKLMGSTSNSISLSTVLVNKTFTQFVMCTESFNDRITAIKHGRCFSRKGKCSSNFIFTFENTETVTVEQFWNRSHWITQSVESSHSSRNWKHWLSYDKSFANWNVCETSRIISFQNPDVDQSIFHDLKHGKLESWRWEIVSLKRFSGISRRKLYQSGPWRNKEELIGKCLCKARRIWKLCKGGCSWFQNKLKWPVRRFDWFWLRWKEGWRWRWFDRK